MLTNNIWINQISFNDWTIIELNRNDIVVFVWPNNTWKSATLKELWKLIKNRADKWNIISEIRLLQEWSDNELIKQLNDTSKVKTEGWYENYSWLGYSIRNDHAKLYWGRLNQWIETLFSYFVKILTTEDRLLISKPAPNFKVLSDAEAHPIHFLKKDDGLELIFSNYFKEAFGVDLVVNHGAGNEIPLHIGTRPIPNPWKDRLSKDYQEKLDSMPLLHEQWDWMRSFVWVLLSIFVGNYSLLFIDEPEAFLHPPQAKLLWKMISKDLSKNKQIFLSTHSQDLLKWLLNSNVENLKIIRIQRDGNINNISCLNNSDISSVWEDPLLRHLNILDGLFHTKVILCESDSDCRFYSSILEAIYESKNEAIPDVMFTHCGWKQRMSMVIKALINLNVPIKVISDFDLINNINPLREIFETLWWEWDDIATNWNVVKSGIESKKSELDKKGAKEKIDAVFGSKNTDTLSDEDVRTIRDIIKSTSPWSIAKSTWKSYIPNWNATKAFNEIQDKLHSFWLYILEIGELEQFAKTISSHWPKWVNEVLSTKNLVTDLELEDARKFIQQVIS